MAVFVLVAAGDLGLAGVSPPAPRAVLALVVALVVEGSPALVSSEAGHFGLARAVAVCAQVPVVAAAARALAALVLVVVLAARDEPDLVVAAAPGALGFVAA